MPPPASPGHVGAPRRAVHVYDGLVDVRGPKAAPSAPYIVVFLSFLAIFVAFTIRICLSQAMIPMAEHYRWSEEQQGYLFGAFYYGYITTIIPGGWFSEVFGSKYVILGGILGSALLNSLSPLAADHSFGSFMVLRVLVGFVQGVFWPSCLHLLSCWIEGRHRTLAVAFVLSGQHLGTAAAQGGYPMLASVYGWRMPFYLIGALGLVWSVLWLCYVDSEPQRPPARPPLSPVPRLGAPRQAPAASLFSSPLLHFETRSDGDADDDSDAGRSSLAAVSVFGGSSEHVEELVCAPIPWWQIFFYPSVWAYYVLFFCYNWSFYLLVSYLPKYLNFVLGYAPSEAGHLAVLAYLGLYVTILVGGRATTYYISQGYPITHIRKLGVTLGLVPAILLLLGIYWLKSASWIAGILIVAVAFTGFAHSAFAPNPMDLIPGAPAMIASFGNVIGTLPGFISSMTAGLILQAGRCENKFPVSDTCESAWQCVFLLCIVIYVIGWSFWVSFASGNPLKRKAYCAPSLSLMSDRPCM